MVTLIQLDLLQLATMVGLILLTAMLLLWLRLRLVNQLLLATARVTIQLLMLGIFGTLILQAAQPLGVLLGSGVLVMLTSIAISNRCGQSRFWPLISGSLLISTLAIAGYVQWLVIRTFTWYEPQYLIALVGILLVSSPAVIVGVGQQFFQVIKQERAAIETHLSLGATASQAISPYRRSILQRSLAPAIQNLAVSGLIAIPTFMAGLILAGVTPLVAAAYQIVVLLMAIVHQIVTAILMVWGLSRFAFDREQLLEEQEILQKN